MAVAKINSICRHHRWQTSLPLRSWLNIDSTWMSLILQVDRVQLGPRRMGEVVCLHCSALLLASPVNVSMFSNSDHGLFRERQLDMALDCTTVRRSTNMLSAEWNSIRQRQRLYLQ